MAFEKDDLYDEAARMVVDSGQASISYLQRRLRIGFSRAARLVDMMEADGLVSPAAGQQAARGAGGQGLLRRSGRATAVRTSTPPLRTPGVLPGRVRRPPGRRRRKRRATCTPPRWRRSRPSSRRRRRRSRSTGRRSRPTTPSSGSTRRPATWTTRCGRARSLAHGGVRALRRGRATRRPRDACSNCSARSTASARCPPRRARC